MIGEILSEPITGVLITVMGGLLLFLITSYIRKRKLFIVVHKSFSHTTLAEKGSAFMLSLHNRGIKTEENVLVQLDKDREYSLLATTDTTIKVENDQISVGRINPNDELNVVLMVEGGGFSHESIIKISSDACRGSVIDSPEKVPQSVANTMGVWIVALFFILGLPLFGAFFGYQFGKDHTESPLQSVVEKKMPEYLVQLDWEGMENFIKSKYYREDEERPFPITIKETRDLRHAALVVFEVRNDGNERLELTAYLRSAADDVDGTTVKFGEHFKHNILVFSGETKTVSLKVNKPDSIKNKTVLLDIRFTYKQRTTYNLVKEFWVE